MTHSSKDLWGAGSVSMLSHGRGALDIGIAHTRIAVPHRLARVQDDRERMGITYGSLLCWQLPRTIYQSASNRAPNLELSVPSASCRRHTPLRRASPPPQTRQQLERRIRY